MLVDRPCPSTLLSYLIALGSLSLSLSLGMYRGGIWRWGWSREGNRVYPAINDVDGDLASTSNIKLQIGLLRNDISAYIQAL